MFKEPIKVQEKTIQEMQEIAVAITMHRQTKQLTDGRRTQNENLRVALNIPRVFERKLKGTQGLLSKRDNEAYPEFELEDKLKVDRGSDDMDPTVGKRKTYDSAD
ncbi:hypothetical protein L195_g048517 [Trifolium pratense]|uniref:Uncharacterized protein n=1 Tax=Trifolium pratense TaxID=57577 RepID=A0A2K3JLK2_TRIPR|nr:hypothetical protein L195_g048517 [Trifolium pratense]